LYFFNLKNAGIAPSKRTRLGESFSLKAISPLHKGTTERACSLAMFSSSH
jgi:hypothetical protein